jgi:hypothetical protein
MKLLYLKNKNNVDALLCSTDKTDKKLKIKGTVPSQPIEFPKKNFERNSQN